MDRFITTTKSAAARAKDEETVGQRLTRKYEPYGDSAAHNEKGVTWKERYKTKDFIAPLLKNGKKPTAAALTKHLLSTLSDPANPITHSDISDRTVHITTAATGHQRGETRINRRLYLQDRTVKMKVQLPEKESETGVLQNVRVYINGYLEDTTDIEMKRIVKLAGGDIRHTASGATHILTSQQLSGSKTHKLLTAKAKRLVHVVRPEWITDSIAAGKRLPERSYEVLRDTSTPDLEVMFNCGGSK